jgi:N4-gp56 family major capsid protein
LQSAAAPKTSGEALETNEQTLTLKYMDITLDEYADAFRWENVMSRIRVTFEHRDEAKATLSDQLANAFDVSYFNQIAGIVGATPGTFVGHNTLHLPTVASDSLIIAGGQATEDALTTADVFTLDLVSEAVQLAKTRALPIRPADVGYPQPLYVCFIHPWQTYQLKLADSRFDKLMQDAMRGGMIGNNPRVTGGLCIWDGCLLVENTRVPISASATTGGAVQVRRAILCGAQAAMVVWGRMGGTPERLRWVEKLFDFDREMGVMGGFVAGIKKSVFLDTSGGANPVAFATIAIATATAA